MRARRKTVGRAGAARRAVGSLVLALLAAASGAPPGTARAQEVASLSAAVRFFDLSGAELKRPAAGASVRVQVSLTDPATGRPPRGLYLSGWIRPRSEDNLSCAEVAQAFRATRNTPVGAADLNGIALVSLTTDASLVVIDPKLNLQSSNMIAAHKFDAPPFALAMDRKTMRAYASFPDKGAVLAVSLFDGARTDPISGLRAPGELLAAEDSALWVAGREGGRLWRIAPDGAILGETTVGAGAVSLRATPPEARRQFVAAYSGEGRLRVLEPVGGEVFADIDLPGPVSDVAFASDDAILATSAAEAALDVVFLDDPGVVRRIRIGQSGARAKADGRGRFVIAFAPESDIVSIVDLASMRVVQSAQLDGASVADVAFTANAAFLLSLDGGFVATIDLAGLGAGKALQLRRIDLGGKMIDAAPGARLLVDMAPAPMVLAVNPANQTGWTIPESTRMGDMPPMDSTRLRGGVPFQVHAVDRSFREARPGRFETVARLLPDREQELVLTTGVGGLTACLPFDADGGETAPARRPLALEARPVDGAFNAGVEEEIAVVFLDERGRRLPIERATLLTPSLQSGWSARLDAVAGEDGELRGRIRFPHPGVFALQPLGVPKPWELRGAVTVEVKP